MLQRLVLGPNGLAAGSYVADPCECTLRHEMQPLLPGPPVLIFRVAREVQSALTWCRRLRCEHLGDELSIV